MRNSIALPGLRPSRQSKPLNVVVLVLLLMLGVGLLASGVLRQSNPPAGLAQALRGPSPPPVQQSAATACFTRSVAAGGVQSMGAYVLVRFADQTHPMKVQFFPTEKAAIRFSYEHGAPNRVYDNTIWTQRPNHFSTRDAAVMSTCLPMP
ncbi:MAG: hypothetical protein ACYCU0_11510 [Solirubrobacteraceae bacterium]